MPDTVGGDSPFIVDISNATVNIQYFITALLHNLGQIGNTIFIISSSWFLLDSKRVKPAKIYGILGDCFVISILFLCIFIFAGYEFPVLYIVRNLMPFTFACNWFVTCYILLYMVHPFLNIIIRTIDKRKLLQINLIFGILYFVIGFLLNNTAFYFSRIIGFIGIYFITAYVKLYLKKTILNVKIQCFFCMIGIVGWLLLMFITNLLGLKTEIFSEQMMRWNIYTNPCFILIAFSLFNIFKTFDLKSKRINYISNLSLLIYVIHCNRIIRDYVRFDIFEYIYTNFTYEYLLLWIILYACVSFVLAIILAVIYKKTVGKVVKRIGDKIYDFSVSYIEKLLSMMEEVK